MITLWFACVGPGPYNTKHPWEVAKGTCPSLETNNPRLGGPEEEAIYLKEPVGELKTHWLSPSGLSWKIIEVTYDPDTGKCS